jgi:hypothetical protein
MEYGVRHLLKAALIAAAFAAALATPLPALADASLSTYEAVRTALIAVWDEMPLTIRNATLVTATPKGFGQYERRAERSFKPDEPVIVYAELYGYGVSAKVSGGYVRELSADLALLDSTGAVRANQVGFWSSAEEFETRPLEMHLSFSATLSAFPAGEYTLRFSVHDAAGGKDVSFDLPILLEGA